MLERVHRCKFCGREFTGTARSRAETPYCQDCYHDRMGHTDPDDTVRASLDGRYFYVNPAQQRAS